MQETREPRAHEAQPPEAGAPEVAEVAEVAEGAEGAPSSEAPAAGEPAPDYHDLWLRAQADLQNFRRRARREVDDARRSAEDAVLIEVIGLLDDLERAEHAGGGAGEAWVLGLRLVQQKARDLLERQGVVVLDPLGAAFDPRYHEAILETEAPEGAVAGTILQVVHKGYRRGERALRAARVVVARDAVL